MTNFELIDDYLTNRLGEQEKLEFERQLGADPALKADVELQRDIIEGVRKARIADLKSMLNNVPVGGGFSSGMVAGKIAATVVTVGIVGTSLYFYFKPTEFKSASIEVRPQSAETIESKSLPGDSSAATNTPPAVAKSLVAEPQTALKKSPKKKEEAKAAETNKPKIEVVDPSDELVDNPSSPATTAAGQKSAVILSHIAVDADASNKKYTFHYQFKGGKLTLFGTFDKSLYEILEIHGDRHAVFLFYKENYYLLNEKQYKITPLEPIKDAGLLKKLKEYRGR